MIWEKVPSQTLVDPKKMLPNEELLVVLKTANKFSQRPKSGRDRPNNRLGELQFGHPCFNIFTAEQLNFWKYDMNVLRGQMMKSVSFQVVFYIT